MSSLYVQQAGLLTTVQDLGRAGYQRYGVPVGGAVDAFALETANALVGNAPDAAALEITLLGPVLAFRADALIAVCGADLSPTVDGFAVPLWRPVFVRRGSALAFGAASAGCRAYVAAAGGVEVPAALGSRSTLARAALGGVRGRALRDGDEVPVGRPSADAERLARALARAAGPAAPLAAARWGASARALPPYAAAGAPAAVRVTRGAEHARFDAASRAALTAEPYAVTPRSDRMGARLAGAPLTLAAPGGELVTEPVTAGTVQVPPDGAPVLLLADRQTTGGYPRIAQVAAADLPVVAQVPPGGRLHFVEIEPEEAEWLYLAQRLELERLKAGIRLRLRSTD
ncbi:biotin-dependent carboxyltransferase family protein [Paenibacillus sp. HJGM_3]|uniref:5-oxoprolinase subunit C family protein n=1 Tax=Paenibacillus sp. HJGM_3 TaxID=3379816 RepID=UPI00385A40EC